MEKRQYGKTEMRLSVIGFGGILVMNETASEASRLVNKAVEAGVNYFDVAPNYGNAQDMLGPALEPFRKGVHLACKTELRRAGEAQKDLENSLRLLKTDYFDIYQLHAVATRQDVDTILGPGGALEVLDRAKREGKVRYLGFSAHSEEAALALLEAYDFDSVLFPVNWATWHRGDFGKRVLPAARMKGAVVLALKTLAKHAVPEGTAKPEEKCWYWPVESYDDALRNLRFTLGMKGVCAAVTPGVERLFDWMVRAEKEFTPLSEDEQEALKKEALKQELIFDAHHSQF